MITKLLYIFTRTPLHVGAGTSIGAIDQPVQRERHTGFPIIPGSSVKGVLRDYFRNTLAKETVDQLFGKGGESEEFSAGEISFGEAKLIAFPVRSAKGAFALAVSPLTLRRLARDAGWNMPVPEVAPMSCLTGSKLVLQHNGQKGVVLEEYRFNIAGEFPKEWEEKLSQLLDDAVVAGATGRFILISDEDLSHFAVNACQINQHVSIDPETGTQKDGALFNEETVPSETLFYSPFTTLRNHREENELFAHLSCERLIQFGGDSTTGLGFCTIKLA